MKFEDRSEEALREAKQKKEYRLTLKEEMELILPKYGELEWINEIPGYLKVRIKHGKDTKSQMKLMEIQTLGTILTGEFLYKKVSFAFSGDKKYMVFTEEN